MANWSAKSAPAWPSSPPSIAMTPPPIFSGPHRNSPACAIFRSAGGDKHFDLDVKQAGGSILLVSNFTVAGATRYGRPPIA